MEQHLVRIRSFLWSQRVLAHAKRLLPEHRQGNDSILCLLAASPVVHKDVGVCYLGRGGPGKRVEKRNVLREEGKGGSLGGKRKFSGRWERKAGLGKGSGEGKKVRGGRRLSGRGDSKEGVREGEKKGKLGEGRKILGKEGKRKIFRGGGKGGFWGKVWGGEGRSGKKILRKRRRKVLGKSGKKVLGQKGGRF